MAYYLLVIVALAVVVDVHTQEIIYPESKDRISESCIQPSGETGICKLITDCPRIAQNVAIQPPKHCGFDGRIPIVCCSHDQVFSDPIRVIDISPPTVDFDCGRPFNRFSFVPVIPEPPIPVLPIPSSAGRRKRAIPPTIPPSPALTGPSNDYDFVDLDIYNYSSGISVAYALDGVEAVINAWPWMALLQRQSRAGDPVWFCGGVLLNEKWVLTAAHCTNRFNATLVRLGEHDFSTDNDGAQFEDVGVAEVIFHPGYRPPQAYHDIALIKLARSITLREDVSPVCLPWGHESDVSLEGKGVTITGWGTTRFFGDGLSPFLNEIDVTVFPTDVCAKSYSTLSDYDENYPQSLGEESLCIGDDYDLERLKDSCPGDSGGPAVLLRDGRYTMVGVVSQGNGCGKKDFPGIYVRVQDPEHLSWIKKVAFSK